MLRRATSLSMSITAMLALGIGLVASGVLSVWLYNAEDREDDLEFQRQADARLAAFETGLGEAEEGLATVNRLFSTVGSVSREQFHQFTQPLLIRYPYIHALAYQRIVSAAERPAYEAAMRKQYPRFTLLEIRDGKPVPSRNKESYRVVQYLEPLQGNEVALGLDASSVTVQDDAVRRASASGYASATGLFRLLQETDSQHGFSTIMPVYRRGAALTDADARRRAVTGFTTAIFRAGDLFEKILARADLPAADGIDISVYAGNAPDERNLAFHQGGAAPWRPPLPLLTHLLYDTRQTSTSSTFDAAGGRWHAVITTSDGTLRGLHARSWFALLAGSLISLLLAAYLQALARRAAALARANLLLTEDIAARKKAELALRRSQAELRELAAHQERVKEDERKRIARDIHDDLGQNLLALRIEVSMLDTHTLAYPTLNKSVHVLLRQIDTTMKSVRAIINNLRPAVLDLGLQAAIEWLVGQFRERSGIGCTLTVDHAGVEFELNDERATAVFRIVQESLTNVSRHACASHVEIRLRRDGDRLVVTVADDGVGSFPGDKRKPRSFGLVGVKERLHALGGDFSIESVPGRGTTLTFSIEVPDAFAPAQRASVPNTDRRHAKHGSMPRVL